MKGGGSVLIWFGTLVLACLVVAVVGLICLPVVRQHSRAGEGMWATNGEMGETLFTNLSRHLLEFNTSDNLNEIVPGEIQLHFLRPLNLETNKAGVGTLFPVADRGEYEFLPPVLVALPDRQPPRAFSSAYLPRYSFYNEWKCCRVYDLIAEGYPSQFAGFSKRVRAVLCGRCGFAEFNPLPQRRRLKVSLPLDSVEREKSYDPPDNSQARQNPIRQVCRSESIFQIMLGLRLAVSLFLCTISLILAYFGHKRWCVWLGAAGMSLGMLLLLAPLRWDWIICGKQDDSRKSDTSQHDAKSVQQKLLTRPTFMLYTNYMANVLSTDKKIAIIAQLSEGSSIRSIERITGVHRDTIMRLGVKVGQGCTALMDAKMRDLSCNRLEMDEIWGFVGKKERNVRIDDDAQVGSVWTFCAIDAETKLVPAFKVGNRDAATANAFVADVASRVKNRMQISTDGLRAYENAIEKAFGSEVDYAQIVKIYGHDEVSNNRRYSAPEFVSSEKKVIVGNPDEKLISTSYVERLNATTRLHMRRLTRLTLAFSKKRENFEAAVGLHFAYYNFVKRHSTLRCTPAMAAGVTGTTWSVGDLVEATA